MRCLTILLAVALLIGCEFRSGTLREVQILEYGRFEKQASEGTYAAQDSLTGKAHAVVAAKLVEKTANIQAVAGISFGLRIKLIGDPAGLAVPYTAKCIHPKITDPSSGRTSEIEQWENIGIIGGDGYVGYTFDNSWEIVPGSWTIQIFLGSKLMAHKTFNITPAW